MIVITSDQITSELMSEISTVRREKNKTPEGLEDQTSLMMQIETELRKDPMAKDLAHIVKAYLLTEFITKGEVPEVNSDSIIMAVRFMTMGVMLGMDIAEKLVRDVKLKEMVNEAHSGTNEADKEGK